MLDVLITPAAWDDADVRRLTADQQAELRARYEGGHEPGTPPSVVDVAVVLVARDADGEAVECGALRSGMPSPRSSGCMSCRQRADGVC